MEEPGGQQGRILRGIAGFYYVETADGEIYECRAKGGFRRESLKPLPGDRVRFIVTHEGNLEGNLTEILPRKNMLIRPAVAGVDQALLFFAVRNPDPSFLLLDRYLLFLSGQAVRPILCFNKTDLISEEETERIRGIYSRSGYSVFFLSVHTGEGIESLLDVLDGKTSFLAGPSGAGKSSFINRICPEAYAQIGELSKKLARGRNTTRHSELFRAAGKQDTWIVDTPGFTALELHDLSEQSVADLYEDFFPYRNNCRFTSCRHMEEPDCAVRAAVEKGELSEVRYENYRRLILETREQQEQRYHRKEGRYDKNRF